MGFASGEQWMTGHQYIFHNTIFRSDEWLPTGGLGGNRIVKHTVSRNNILHVRQERNFSASHNRRNADNDFDYDLAALVSFTDKAEAAGKKPATRVLRFETMRAAQAGAEVLGALRVQPHDELYYLERLRLADGVPVILEHRHIVGRFCTGLDKDAIKGSLYAAWTERLKLEIAGADQVIRAVAIRDADARLLQIANGAAGLLVTSTGYLSGGVPLWREQTLYRGDAYEFHNRLGPIQAARPAAGVLLDLTRSKQK